MTLELTAAMERLSPTQRQPADWGEGACLVLAGPGVGKTTALTTRIARILDASRNRNFRILALTFTTKAGDEMRKRVEELVPGLTDRTVIGTFHSFSAQMLRQHGSHLGIKPDFGVYDQDSDREELLRDALRNAAKKGEPVSLDDARWLKTIDQLRSHLVGPDKTPTRFRDAKAGEQAARAYSIYEAALRERNIMDFNGRGSCLAAGNRGNSKDANAITHAHRLNLVMGNGVVTDAADDKAAWETATRAIRAEKGGEIDLPELLQGLALRPKEPPPDPG